jgi:hypothetical protein
MNTAWVSPGDRATSARTYASRPVGSTTQIHSGSPLSVNRSVSYVRRVRMPADAVGREYAGQPLARQRSDPSVRSRRSGWSGTRRTLNLCRLHPPAALSPQLSGHRIRAADTLRSPGGRGSSLFTLGFRDSSRKPVPCGTQPIASEFTLHPSLFQEARLIEIFAAFGRPRSALRRADGCGRTSGRRRTASARRGSAPRGGASR